MNIYYYHVLLKDKNGREKSYIVKTPCPSLSQWRAIDILKQSQNLQDEKNYEIHFEEIDYETACKIPARGGIKNKTVLDELRDGTVFYREPGHTTQITIVRTDPNGDQLPLTDIVTVPAFLVNKDCNGKAVKQLMKQIANEFLQTPNAQSVFPDMKYRIATWNEFVNIPAPFLSRYGVSITPAHDTMLVMEVSMDSNVIG